MKAIYKCKICGKAFDTYKTGRDMAKKILIGIELEDRELLKRIGAQTAFPTCTHFCEDGSLGIAEFLGFKMEENEEDAENDG